MKSLTNISISLILFVSLTMPLPVFGQFANSPDVASPMLPKAFVLADFEEISEKYAPEYQHLLDACDGNLDKAFEKWLEMLTEMERESKKQKINLSGVKMWMQVYFDESGGIDHIGFFLKPNSKNIDQRDLRVFLEKFARSYQFPITANSKYTHYTTVSFPVYADN